MRFVGKIAMLIFNDTEEKAVEKAIAALADMIPLEAIQPPHSPALIFPGLEIRLHQRRVLKDGVDVSLTWNTAHSAILPLVRGGYSQRRKSLKKDLRLQAHLTTNHIANMGKGEHISMPTLIKICETLNCDISDVIALVPDDDP